MEPEDAEKLLNEACERKAKHLLDLYDLVTNQQLLNEQLEILEENIEAGVENIQAVKVLLDHVCKEIDELKFKIQVLRFTSSKK